MYLSAMFFSVTRHQILLVAIVVNLVYTYLTRIQFVDQVVPSIYHTWYYTTLLGEHRKGCQRFRD